MDVLSGKEWAFVIWTALFFVFIIVSPNMKSVRNGFRKVLNAFFSRTIVSILTLMLIYISTMVYGLAKLGLWETHQLKNTIVWTVSVAVVCLFRLDSLKENPETIKRLVLDFLTLLAVIELVIGVYTFGFTIWLALVPIILVLSIGSAFAQTNNKFGRMGNVSDWLLGAIGTSMILFALYKLATNFGEFAQKQTLYDFGTPILLTGLYLPFILFMMIYSTYQIVFVRIHSLIPDPGIRRFAKMYSFWNFHINLRLAERWPRVLHLYDQTSKDGIRKSVKGVIKMALAEQNPKEVPLSQGWSPYKAKDFLVSEGVETGYYQPVFNNEWHASSPIVDIGEGVFRNYMEYYVDGDENRAQVLILRLNVASEENDEIESLAKFISSVKTLLKAAVDIDDPSDVEKAILEGNSLELNIGPVKASIEKNVWSEDRLGRYDIKLTLSVE